MTNGEKRGVWITWERQTRNISMSSLLGTHYFELKSNSKGIVRYIQHSFKTLYFLFSDKPEVVYFQTPSIVLGVCCVLYKKIFGKCKLVGDFHNAAFKKQPAILYAINKFICRNSDVTLISNPFLVELVHEMSGAAQVFPDPIPEPELPSQLVSDNQKYLLLICSWADDEPVNDIIDAFVLSELKQSGYLLCITGRKKTGVLNREDNFYTSNGIEFTGFVDEVKYWDLLRAAQAVIDLTTRKDCLVCGAYESLAVCTPVILSNNQASVEYFSGFAIFTDNSVDDLSRKILLVVDENLKYKERARSQLHQYKYRDEIAKSNLLNRL